MSLLNIENLSVVFTANNNQLEAVADVSFSLKQGEKLGVVGESGCGKSVTSLAIMKLLPDNARVQAKKINFNNIDLINVSEKEMQNIRGNDISMIFQEPMTSLNPVMKVGTQIAESVKLHDQVSIKQAKQRAYDIMTAVGLPEVYSLYKRYPHELSGGMRQRVMIAMAMVLKPKLLIADEPTTALDVTIQAQIIDLMNELNKKQGTAIILISHDLGVVKQMCDNVMVMYLGQVVEMASTKTLFANTLHPYTKGLLASIPNPRSKVKQLHTIPGRVPPLNKRPCGCPFSPRCPKAQAICTEALPDLMELTKNHFVRCFFPNIIID